jgi:hypothetical protein
MPAPTSAPTEGIAQLAGRGSVSDRPTRAMPVSAWADPDDRLARRLSALRLVSVSQVYGDQPVYAAGQVLNRRPSWAADDAERAAPLVPGRCLWPAGQLRDGHAPGPASWRLVSLDCSLRPAEAQLDGAIRAFHKVCALLADGRPKPDGPPRGYDFTYDARGRMLLTNRRREARSPRASLSRPREWARIRYGAALPDALTAAMRSSTASRCQTSPRSPATGPSARGWRARARTEHQGSPIGSRR